MKARFLLFLIISIFMLSGCYQKNPYGDIPWSVTNISHAGCSQLNGIYEANKEVYEAFVFIGTSSHNRRGYTIATTVEYSKKIPFQDGKLHDKKDVYGRTTNPITGKPYGTYRDEDTSRFWKTAKISIRQEEQKLIVTLMDKDGVAYRRVTIGIQNQDVSCNENGFYLRFFNEHGGNEFGTPCDLSATEFMIKKSSFGDLQLEQSFRSFDVMCLGGWLGDIHYSNTKTWTLKKLED